MGKGGQEMKKSVAIIGAGSVGSSVGCLLSRAGYRITSVMTPSIASASMAAGFIGAGEPTTNLKTAVSGAEIVFITTPDRVIKEVCQAAAKGGGLMPGAVVVHMSGAHTLDLLDAARAAGAYRAVLHPLQSVPNRQRGLQNLPGSSFRVEADPEAEGVAKELVTALGGNELKLPKWRPDRHSAALYHAGAVAVSNYFVAVVAFGLQFYEALGADRREALKAVLPLIRGTLDNIETIGVPRALTGPIERGDIETIRGHLDAMRQRAPGLLPLYRALARQTVAVARDKGSIVKGTEEKILELLQD
jgi:predicted short-subunit dehydrogenase-like oxidoreductase (DUF2520 family)